MDSIRLDWNDITRSWGGETVTTGQFTGETIDHPIVFEGYTSHLGDITVGVYSPDTTGALIGTSGNAEFRTVKLDSLSIKTSEGYIPLAEYIENIKADSKHDWGYINNLAEPPDTLRIVMYDTENNLKYYATIGQLKDLFKTDRPDTGGGITLLTSTDLSAAPADTRAVR